VIGFERVRVTRELARCDDKARPNGRVHLRVVDLNRTAP
jgi:hypothetical protein